MPLALVRLRLLTEVSDDVAIKDLVSEALRVTVMCTPALLTEVSDDVAGKDSVS